MIFLKIVRFDMKLLDQLTSDPKAGVYVEIKESATQTSVQKRLVPFNETTKMSFTSEKGIYAPYLQKKKKI